MLPPADAPRITLERNPNWNSGTDFRPAFVNRIVLEQRSPGPSALARRVLGGSAAADRVVVLDAGHVVEQGSPADLRAAGGHYTQLEAESERLT